MGGALIVAHDIARERLLAKGPGHWPVLTFDATMTIHFNDEVVRLLAIPGGHTDNDVVVFFERARGESLESILAAGVADEYRDWGYGHTSAEDWLTMIFMSLSGMEN